MIAVQKMSGQPKGDRAGEAPLVEQYAESLVPTRYGEVRVVVFRGPSQGDALSNEHVAMVFGDVQAPGPVLVRAHSECLTSEVLGSLKCDCREQLEAALRRLQEIGRGVLLYLRQEGRGIGLGNKIRAYALQAQGVDTVDANHELGFGVDERDYDIAAAMLRALGVETVELLTNNPEKVEGLARHGIEVARRAPMWVPAHAHSDDYLETKRRRMGHLDDDGSSAADSGA